MSKRLNFQALSDAFEALDVDALKQFYKSDVEHTEIDAGAPPRSPRTSGWDYIAGAVAGAAQAGIKIHLNNPVLGEDRVACTITCEFPDGRRMVSNTIYDLDDGKIVRQLDVQVMDPEQA